MMFRKIDKREAMLSGFFLTDEDLVIAEIDPSSVSDDEFKELAHMIELRLQSDFQEVLISEYDYMQEDKQMKKLIGGNNGA